MPARSINFVCFPGDIVFWYAGVLLDIQCFILGAGYKFGYKNNYCLADLPVQFSSICIVISERSSMASQLVLYVLQAVVELIPTAKNKHSGLLAQICRHLLTV